MKTNLSRLPLIIAAITCLSITSLYSQVTVGSDIPPTRAALLDLKMQQSAGVPSVLDDANITSTTGGLLLPRVKLKSLTTLEPFIPVNDQDWTENTDNIKARLAGLMVYNLTSDGDAIYPAVYTWDGEKWTTSQINEVAALTVAKNGQPKAFTFYEQGTETVQPLTFSVNGGKGTLSYQWYQYTGSNVHVRVGTPIGTGTAISGSTPTASSFTPTGVKKGKTTTAGNCGFYRFYCEVTDEAGQLLRSDVAEVAVGCGAKNNAGEWLSFMCFNLGAENEISINEQINREFISYNDSADSRHYHMGDAENKLYGDLFQWGRVGDGHQIRTSSTTTFASIQDSDVGSGNRCTPAGTVLPENQIKPNTTGYTRFITTSSSNWYHATTPPDNLWRTGVFYSNDPCSHYIPSTGAYQEFWNGNGTDEPAIVDGTSLACSNPNNGWRLPAQSEWGELYKGGFFSGTPGTATANSWKWVSSGSAAIIRPGETGPDKNTQRYYDRAGGFRIQPDNATTTLFLPASGYRHNNIGALYFLSQSGNYWSSSITGASAYNLNFSNNIVNPNTYSSRARGFAIRCIKHT
jgi:hypothetical protein